MRRLFALALLCACTDDTTTSASNPTDVAANTTDGGFDPGGTPGPGSDAVNPSDAPAADDAAAADDATPPDDTAAAEDIASPSDAAPPSDVALFDDTAALSDTPMPEDTGAEDTAAEDTGAEDTATAGDAGPAEDTTTAPCVLLPPDHDRVVILSRPYNANSSQSDAWEVRPLLEDGALGAPTAFTMGRAVSGVVAFRPDGGLAAAVDEHGNTTLVALSVGGLPSVVGALSGDLVYAESVQFAADGESLLVVDHNWPNNGGGLYRVPVACDGSLGAVTPLVQSKLAVAAVPFGDQLIVAARAVGNSAEAHVHLLSGAGQPLAAAKVFPDLDDILSSVTVTPDRRYVLVGDNSEFSGIPTRVGVAEVVGNTLVAKAPISPIEDPMALVASPLGDSVLVVSGYGDAVRVLAYDPDAATPFVDMGEPDYIGASPALPADAVLVPGDDPLVLVAENVAVHRFRFVPGGVVDLGVTAAGDGVEDIVGAIGVQP